MPETNRELPPQIRPPLPSSLQDKLKQQRADFVLQAKKNPQLMLLLNQTKTFWNKFAFRVKLLLSFIGIIFIILIGLRFGTTLARVFKPAPVVPTTIPDITPSPVVQIDTDLQKIQAEIHSFSILLPDPAVPPVDPEIYLESLPIED